MSAAVEVRRRAGVAVARVAAQGVSLSRALPDALAELSGSDAALLKALCYGALRHYPRLEYLLGLLLERPLERVAPELRGLLCVGLFQLTAMRVPAHAAVSETVSAAKRLKRGAAAGLVNAVMRRYLRERETLEALADRDESARYAHPAWMIDAFKRDWPSCWRELLAAGNEQAPMWLRVNLAKLSRSRYQEILSTECKVRSRPSVHAPAALELDAPVDVQQLPGFREGLVSVQDAAAQLGAPLLGAEPGMRVLDACAAPGGKTAHLLEICPGAEVVAVDRDPQRLQPLRETLARLGARATVLAGDAAAPDEWWDGRKFERILLDAPCTATGVIRRHPDIKLLRRASDVEQLAAEQARLLASLWPLLAHGGLMVYATCSVLSAENDEQIRRFLHEHPRARANWPNGTPLWGRPSGDGRQVLPGEDAMDGFYYACIKQSPRA